MKQNMMPRLKRAFTENLSLKILAVAFSIILWLIVVNVDDPSQTKTFTTNVDFVNGETLTEAGKYYEVPEGSNTVSFRVTGKRSVLERMDGPDFTAVADLNYIEEDYRVPVTITVNTNSSNVTISAKRVYVQLVVGDEVTNKHDIDVETTGDLASGCIIDEATADPSSISVTGPDDVISRIARVVAYADVDGKSEDFSTSAALHFLDQDGNEIDQSRLNISQDMVTVNVTVLSTKKVSVAVATTGSLGSGLSLGNITVDPSEVMITGSAETLNDITQVTISGSAFNLSNMTSTLRTTIDLRSYLPTGVGLADGVDTQVSVTIPVSGTETQSYRVDTDNLSVHNLADGLTVNFDASSVQVQITGDASTLASLSAADLTGYVDASGLTAGTHTMTVIWELSDGVRASTVTTNITITEN